MQDFELKITKKDWLKIILLSLILAKLLSVFIYLLLELPPFDGLLTGLILGLYLGLLSFASIHLNNTYLLPRIRNGIRFWWWFLAGVASIFAGALGFYLAYQTAVALNLAIPSQVPKNLLLLSLIVGFLNYLIGLLIFLFINMRNRKETLLRKTLYLRNLSYLRMVESHFLSNLINNIVELMNRDLEKAESALIKLAKFLRFILDERDLVSLAEELELVRIYIELQGIRFQNSISFTYELDDPIMLNITVPKFSLQMLVENAIKHGYTGKPLHIHLRGKVCDGGVELYVENDGKEISAFSMGSGLKLLKERLELHLNGALELVSTQPVTFCLSFPLEKAIGQTKINPNTLKGGELTCLKRS